MGLQALAEVSGMLRSDPVRYCLEAAILELTDEPRLLRVMIRCGESYRWQNSEESEQECKVN